DAAARGVNDVMNEMTEFFQGITMSDTVTEKTAESHAAVDVAGLNYAEARYAPDSTTFPNRVVLGTETNPRSTASSWRQTLAHDHVIGGFTWTGWDYLGEVGLGRTDYTDDPEVRGGGDPAFPWLTAWAGDLDITGYRRPQSYYREIVFGLRHHPYIAVLRPLREGQRRLEMQWAWSDAISSWTWGVAVGSPLEVEVYSDAEEVELFLDGVSSGRRPVGSDDLTARFELGYRSGELTAVSYRDGVETGRSTIRTARDGSLRLSADRSEIRADTTDLAFVTIDVRDDAGSLDTSRSDRVDVEIDGPAVLQAVGSARPSSDEDFAEPWCTLFDGRALAIVRPTGPGLIRVTARTEDGAPATATIRAV
ncbi:MAG TPA: DUF4982 domain-containing protein, partial [Pseudolysinimonas sp.]|nr:DUF4982 domain-containing protein [Pseudolysinimonas sp.]